MITDTASFLRCGVAFAFVSLLVSFFFCHRVSGQMLDSSNPADQDSLYTSEFDGLRSSELGLLEPPSPDSLPSSLSTGPWIEDVEIDDHMVPGTLANRFDETPVPRFRKSWFQGLQITGGWLSDDGDDGGLGMTYLDVQLRSGIPLGSFDNILAVAPTFRVDYLEGPNTLDVPPRLFETGVNFFWMRTLSPRWSTRVLVAPMVRSDFTTDDRAVRVFALGLAVWQWVPQELELSFGVVSLGRDDIPVLPALGLVWTPTPWWKLEAVFPRPRIAYRIDKDGPRSETWVYLSGALGGNTWAVTRQSGDTDQLSIRDYRLIVGVEQLRAGGAGSFVEAGWVFGRELEYERQPASLEFDDSFALRAGWTF